MRVILETKYLKMHITIFLLSSKHENVKFSIFSSNLGTRSQTLNMFMKHIYLVYKSMAFFSNISQYYRCHKEKNAPHKSFCQLVYKIKYFVPVLCYTSRSEKKAKAISRPYLRKARRMTISVRN